MESVNFSTKMEKLFVFPFQTIRESTKEIRNKIFDLINKIVGIEPFHLRLYKAYREENKKKMNQIKHDKLYEQVLYLLFSMSNK